MHRRALACLVVSFFALLPLLSPLAAAEGTSISSPIVHGNLAIFLVHGAAAGGAAPLTAMSPINGPPVKINLAAGDYRIYIYPETTCSWTIELWP